MEDREKKHSEEKKREKGFEERLDKAADRITRTVSEGIKRMEEAFERSKENIKESTNISDRYKQIFNYPTGGFLLLVIGFVWLMYTVGFFQVKWFPVILMIIGLYMMLKKRST